MANVRQFYTLDTAGKNFSMLDEEQKFGLKADLRLLNSIWPTA